MKHFWAFFLSLLSAGLFVFSFEPYNFLLLGFICLVPLIYLNSELALSPKAAFLYNWLFAFLISLGGFYWVAHTAHEFAYLPQSISNLVLILFALVQFIWIPCFFFFWQKVPALKKTWGVWSIPLCWSLWEEFFPQVFPFRIGYFLGPSTLLRQMADIAGPFGLSLWLLCFNMLVFLTLRNFFKNSKKVFKPIAAIFILLAFGFIYGYLRVDQLKHFRRHHFQKSVKVALIQANIGNFEKVNSEKGAPHLVDEIFQKYLRLSKQAYEHYKPDWILWPETAIPVLFPQESYEKKIYQWLRENPVRLFFGGYLHRAGAQTLLGQKIDSEAPIANAILSVKPYEDKLIKPYLKQKLLPFGEDIPFGTWFPFLRRIVPEIGYFIPGPGFELFDWQGLKILPLICYEAILPELLLKIPRSFELMINVTNDSWYGPWAEPFQHSQIARFRAVEWRVPMIRITNTGVSSLIDPYGEFIAQTPLDQEAILEGRLYLSKQAFSLYAWWGRFWPFCFFLWYLVILFRYYRILENVKLLKASRLKKT